MRHEVGKFLCEVEKILCQVGKVLYAILESPVRYFDAMDSAIGLKNNGNAVIDDVRIAKGAPRSVVRQGFVRNSVSRPKLLTKAVLEACDGGITSESA
jgi:hypothetical protein